MLNGEIVADDNGDPVVGRWESIIDPATWRAIDAIMAERKGRIVGPDGANGNVLPVDFAEHRYLLSGILRCGKSKDTGAACNAPMRARRFGGDSEKYHYVCPPKSQGGCSGIGRHGPRVDEYISEAVLAKLEERSMRVLEGAGEWPGAEQLAACQRQLDELGQEWRAGGMSNEFFFSNVRHLEQRIGQLRAEEKQHELRTKRRSIDVEEVRRRWYAPEEDGGFDIAQKRAYVREALHAVIVHPTATQGRTPFDPDLLEPVWRED
jgi:Recombinase zinc beta ribbon domain